VARREDDRRLVEPTLSHVPLEDVVQVRPVRLEADCVATRLVEVGRRDDDGLSVDRGTDPEPRALRDARGERVGALREGRLALVGDGALQYLALLARELRAVLSAGDRVAVRFIVLGDDRDAEGAEDLLDRLLERVRRLDALLGVAVRVHRGGEPATALDGEDRPTAPVTARPDVVDDADDLDLAGDRDLHPRAGEERVAIAVR